MNRGIFFWAFAAGAVTAAALVPETGVHSPDGTWIKAVAICVLHLFVHQLRPLLNRYTVLISSFAGGMSVTYVFGSLLPELSLGHKVVGDLIFLIVLVGFVIYYGLDRRVRMGRPEAEGNNQRSAFMLTLGSYWLYNWLIVFGLPDGASVSAIHVSLMTVAMGLHLGYNDYLISNDYPALFDRWGRFVLATAPIVGLLCRFYLRPHVGELPKDILTAILAGSIIYSVFKNELPYPERTRFGVFLVGITTYTVLLILAKKF